MKVKEFFELYEAAKAGKKITKDAWYGGNYTNGYIDEDVDFLNEDMQEVLSEKSEDGMHLSYSISQYICNELKVIKWKSKYELYKY